MLPQIGWIGPVQLAPLLEEARPGLASRCQLLLPCTDPAKAAALYRENQAGCQGFVFSNPLLQMMPCSTASPSWSGTAAASPSTS